MRRSRPLLASLVPTLFALAGPAAAARGAAYTATVLYPLSPPADGYDADSVGRYGLAVSPDGRAVASTRVPAENTTHTLAWTGPAQPPVDLHPTQLTAITAAIPTYTDGPQQVGVGYGPTLTNGGHAILWSGTAASAVDLHPAGYANSLAAGVGGGQQVGAALGADGRQHPVLWSGSAASVVDLTPTSLPGPTGDGQASATDGTQQVGDRYAASGDRAVLWSGTAASAVDLHPTGLAGVTDTVAFGVGGGRQVGWGYDRQSQWYNYRALLWAGSAASIIDLTPTDLPVTAYTFATATNGPVQAGYFNRDPARFDYGADHAIAWAGTAASAVDLHPLLPADGYWGESYATAVGVNGDVYGYALGTYDGFAGPFAVRWSAAATVPEPGVGLGSV